VEAEFWRTGGCNLPTETALPVSKFPHPEAPFRQYSVHCAIFRKRSTFNKNVYPLYWIPVKNSESTLKYTV
jgi:hypothetical protein